MLVQTYLSFEGRCEEALEFYGRHLGAKVQMMMRYKDAPQPPPEDKVPGGSQNKIMHSTFTIGDTTLMASDGYCTGKPNLKGFSLSIAVTEPAEADRIFTALAAGGEVTMPLAQTFWSPRFGMLTDKFGLCWMVNVLAPQ